MIFSIVICILLFIAIVCYDISLKTYKANVKKYYTTLTIIFFIIIAILIVLEIIFDPSVIPYFRKDYV